MAAKKLMSFQEALKYFENADVSSDDDLFCTDL